MQGDERPGLEIEQRGARGASECRNRVPDTVSRWGLGGLRYYVECELEWVFPGTRDHGVLEDSEPAASEIGPLRRQFDPSAWRSMDSASDGKFSSSFRQPD
jgi:hypothetical protein